MSIADRLAMAAGGFLLAVLWFDLMFDVQVLSHRAEPVVPDDVLDSIARYYRRVTTDASPMGRLVGIAMLTLLGSLITQVFDDNTATWISATSIAATVFAVGLTIGRVLRNARRLGSRADTTHVQSQLARRICTDHLFCAAAMLTVFVTQLLR